MFAKFYWRNDRGITNRLEVMAFTKGYLMCRYKGCMPFVIGLREFEKSLASGYFQESNPPKG